VKLPIELTDQEYADLCEFAKMAHQSPGYNADFLAYRAARQMAVDIVFISALKAIRQAHYSEMTKEFIND